LTHRSALDRFICVGDSDPEKLASSQSDKSDRSYESDKLLIPELKRSNSGFSSRTFARKLNQIPEMNENLEDSDKMMANSTEEDMISVHKTQVVKSKFESLQNSSVKISILKSHDELQSREIITGQIWTNLDQGPSPTTPHRKIFLEQAFANF
jgi:hypothetical protein